MLVEVFARDYIEWALDRAHFPITFSSSNSTFSFPERGAAVEAQLQE